MIDEVKKILEEVVSLASIGTMLYHQTGKGVEGTKTTTEYAQQICQLCAQEKQEAIRQVFEEIETNFQYYIESTNDGFIFHEDRWQALKDKFLKGGSR